MSGHERDSQAAPAPDAQRAEDQHATSTQTGGGAVQNPEAFARATEEKFTRLLSKSQAENAELQAQLAKYQQAEEQRKIKRAEARGDYEKIRAGLEQEIQKQQQNHAAYQKRVQQQLHEQRCLAALAEHGITDEDILSMVMPGFSKSIEPEFEADTLQLTGDYSEKAAMVAAKLAAKFAPPSDGPVAIVPGTPAANTTQAKPEDWRVRIRQDSKSLLK